ncbi:MAG: lysozyme [Dysosmobacter sp.]|nr:lysozyme [Dysosmobacter sp.]
MSKPIGTAGLALIKQFEGCRLTAYKPVPTETYWTIGWGHYGPDVREGQTITQAQADAMLAADCQRFADAVDNPAYCPLTAQLNANQRDALISFTFNCGAGCLKTLCKGRTLPQICTAMALYNKSNGKPLAGLTRRRKAEQELFNTPIGKETKMDNTPKISKEAVEWAKANGILNGSQDGDLMLSSPCTREQMVVFLFRYHRKQGGG